MKIPILMPQMGQSVAEGTVLKWRKQVGGTVRVDEVIAEIETDKAAVEVESPVDGTLTECLKQAGEIAAAGEVIGYIESESALPHFDARRTEPMTVKAAPAAPRPNHELPEIDRDQYSPAVLRLAMLNNLSLAELDSLPGTGRGGRVTRNDVLAYLARRPVGAASVQALAGKTEVSSVDLAALGRVVPMTSIRKTIADHLVQSIHTSAHVTMMHAVDMTQLVAVRERIKEDFQRAYGAKMTYTAVMLFVTSRVLSEFPMINASVSGTNLILRNEINIGCAVALPDESLVVPVVRRADSKSFAEVAQELARLIARARNRELGRTDVDSGTFTISNFGAFGSLIGTPIIHQPQVAILGMGAVFKAPVVQGEQIVIRDQLYLSFSFDHRVIDGALGGRFLNAIQHATEALTPETLGLSGL